MAGSEDGSARRDRREFLRGVARGAILGGLGLAAAKIALQRGGRVGRRDRRLACVNRGVCPGCAKVRTCALPQAILARRAGRG
jgi:hypothetical protein